jgi:hypothetical protein
MKIKNILYTGCLVSMMFTLAGCKKFLNVTPIQAQSGNNYWKNREDVEKFTNGIYTILREKVGGRPSFFRYYDKMFFPAMEMRNNNLTINGNIDAVSSLGNPVIQNLIIGNMRGIANTNLSGGVNVDKPDYPAAVKNIMTWNEWYDIIANANILYKEVDNVPKNTISETDVARYKGEAVFLRNLAYMFICKLFGDAVHNLEAYSTSPLARMPQVEVLKKCIADMKANKDLLPVRYEDASLNGFRPTRGAAIALLMHLNMWASAWDNGDKNQYYTAVKSLAEELDTYSDYATLQINATNTKLIFKGRTTENLFGILQESNFGEGMAFNAVFSYFTAHVPLMGKQQRLTSFMYYDKTYIEKLFPSGVPDARQTTWFENYNVGSGAFQFKKFSNLQTFGSGTDTYIISDDSAIIFRLPDCYLLTAEAMAAMDDDGLARQYANRVRALAGAPEITSAGDLLDEEIYLERCRELIGEGQFYFDLVRTKRIFESKFTKNPMSVSQLNAGAWTWPLILSSDDKTANPYLVGNNYWN